MLAFAWFILLFACVRFLIVWINRHSRFKPCSKKQENHYSVAVLVPARNEEGKIGILLNQLRNQTRQADEIMVYNDLSTDGTADEVRRFQSSLSQLKLLEGDILPNGWLGKNHACHKLALKTKAEYLIFLDADVQIEPDFLSQVLSYAQQEKLKLFSMFPKQIMLTFSEQLIVPLMNWVLLSLLPMQLIRKSSIPSLSAANGQFMLFEGENYRQHKYHQLFKNNAVEDIRIIQYMKSMNYNVNTLISNGIISCRMYENGKEARLGFKKNVFAFFGNSPTLAILFTGITSFGWIAVGWNMGIEWMMIYLLIAFLIRAIAFRISGQRFRLNVYQPLQQIFFTWIVMGALLAKFNQDLTWKGRNIYE